MHCVLRQEIHHACAVTDFPGAGFATTQTISLAPTVMLMPRTAMRPVATAPDGKERSAISRTVRPCQTRCIWDRRVAHPVAQHVDREDGHCEEHAGIDDVMGEQAEHRLPSAMMLPQVGTSGGTPMPRNERMASTRMAAAQMKVPCTIIGGRARHVAPQQFRVEVPSVTAAST